MSTLLKLIYHNSPINIPSRGMSKLVPRLKELRIHLCQTGASSKGVREFIENEYVPLKKANPNFPILVRECSGIQPRLWARYEFGEERCVCLKGSSSADVAAAIHRVNH